MKKQSFQNIVLKTYLRGKKFFGKKSSLQDKRANMDERGLEGFPGRVAAEQIALRGIPAMQLTPENDKKEGLICYLHGGGYVSGSMHSHVALCATLALEMEAQTIVPDYSLAPEAPFPAAVNDAVASIEWLMKRFPDRKLILMGDSAGGGLAVASMLKLKEENLPLPEAAVLLAPWLDLTLAHPSIPKIERQDPILTRAGLLADAKRYHRDADPRNPYVSPLFADDFSGFPPTLIQVGTHDLLLPDSQEFSEKLQKSHVQVSLEEWHKMVHVWQVQLDKIPEARKSIVRIGDFIRSAVKK